MPFDYADSSSYPSGEQSAGIEMEQDLDTDNTQQHGPGLGDFHDQCKSNDPSLPPDTAVVTVRVEWTGGKVPDRLENWLHLAVQKWISGEFKAKPCDVLKVQILKSPDLADITVTPSSALEGLLEQKSVKLMRREYSAVVHFMESVTSPQNPSVQQFTHAPPTPMSGVNSPTESPDNKEKTVDETQGPPDYNTSIQHKHTFQGQDHEHEIPMTVTAEVDVNRFSPKALDTLLEKYNNVIKSSHDGIITLKGTFEEINMFYQDLSKLSGQEGKGWVNAKHMNKSSQTENNENTDFKVPLFQYWYLNQAYSKEMHLIESKYGVNIESDVFVLIKSNSHQSIKDDNLSKAREDFQVLVQKIATNLDCISIPHSHLESDIVKETMKHIQTDKARMILSMSAEDCKLLAPQQQASMVARRLGVGRKEDRSESDFSKTARHLIMDEKDPHLSSELSMSQIHWDLIRITHEKEIEDIINNFGVVFQSSEPSPGTVKVTVQPRRENFEDLKIHALRALTHLYQKVAMATVTCTMRSPAPETIVQTKEIIHSGHPFVGIEEKNGSYRLVGLPVHLGPAVTEVEKILSHPVFHDKEKQMTGYYESGYGNGAEAGPVWTGGAQHREATRRSKWGKGEESKAIKMDDGEEETCPICMDHFKTKEKLICGHGFCRECVWRSVESMGPICPVCKKVFGKVEGNQPDGTMNTYVSVSKLQGFPDCNTIVIDYSIPDGIQTEKHPNPGKRYYGTQKRAYLPDNKEGRHVLKLLERAFDQKLIFAVGTSRNSEADDSVTWNDIHHKTSTHGGPQCYGYPDPDYLKRVKEELKAKGIE